MPPPRGFLLLLLAQIFGVAFFGGRRRKLTFLPLFLLVSYSYLGNFSVKKTRENVAKSLITSEILNLLVSTVNLPLKLPYYYAKRKELEKLVRLVDESVADLRGVSFGSPLRVAAFLVANALLEFASFYPRHGTLFLLTYFTHWSSLYIGCVEHALVSDLLAKLRLRLKLLNGDVLSLLEESRSLAARFKVGRRIGKAGAFEPLLEERLRLLGASERICSLFALPTLLLFGSNLILLVISAHSSITTTKSILLLGGNLKAVTLALTNLYWITAILLHCLSIVDTWGSFRAEAERTISNLHGCWNRARKPTGEHLKFARGFDKLRTRYGIFGVLLLDRSLLTTMVCSASTYVIVLMQFESIVETKVTTH